MKQSSTLLMHQDLDSQVDYLEQMLGKSTIIRQVLGVAPRLRLPNWYLGSGAIAQTVWNELHGYPLDKGIKDCDLIYFDPDTSYEAEDAFIQSGKVLFKSLPIAVEIRNEARVHLWYEQKHGKEMRQYISTEDAIDTWPTTATSIGVRYDHGKFMIYAPYGLHDLLGMIVRPNKTLITNKVYEEKVKRWSAIWPKLTVIPWDV